MGEVDATLVAAGEGRAAPRKRSATSYAVFLPLIAAVFLFAAPLGAKETLVKDVAEFDAAVKAAQAGDQIILADGEWRDADLVLRGEGAEDAPIIVRAQTPGKVLLSGTSRLRLGGFYLVVRNLLWRAPTADDCVIQFRIDSKTLANFSVLDQCAIIDDAPGKERKWVSLYGSGNIVVSSRFEGKQSGGTLLVVWVGEGRNHHKIQSNFFGPRPRLGKNGGEIIRIGDSKSSLTDSETLVRKNYFYRCDGETEIISNKSCLNRYFNNVFVGCSGALTLRHGDRCFVNHNFFVGDGCKGTGGVRIIGEDHVVTENTFVGLTGEDARAAICLMNGVRDSPLNGYFQVRRAIVSENTLIDCKQNIVIGLADEDQSNQIEPPRDCLIHRCNVISRGEPVFVCRTAPIGMKHEDNLYSGGELGLDVSEGWKRTDEADKKKTVTEYLQVLADNNFRGRAELSLVGPSWMRPGDEYLPQALKKAK